MEFPTFLQQYDHMLSEYQSSGDGNQHIVGKWGRDLFWRNCTSGSICFDPDGSHGLAAFNLSSTVES